MPHPLLIIYLLVYLALHSLLASRACKNWLARFWGRRWYRLGYSLFAVVGLVPVPLLFWYLPDQTLYTIPAPWFWLCLAGQVAAGWGIVTTFERIDLGEFLGFRPERSAGELIVDGWYAYMRHPSYSFGIVVMWLSPWMTVNLLGMFVLLTLYCVIGSYHEEARLRQEFGAQYLDYQQRVGRFWPRVSLRR